MTERSSIFDMIGPVMIGPSSSHTAGVVRIGRVARRILGTEPLEAEVVFYNSFATTYEGHGSDRAIVAGLLDYKTDDERIRDALALAPESGLQVTFKTVGSASKLHPNTLKVKLKGEGRTTEVMGVSRGGGLISIVEVDGFHSNFSAQLYTLLVTAKDIKGSIAFIATVAANDDSNIATMTVSRNAKNDTAKLILEMDSGLRPTTLAYLQAVEWIHHVVVIPDIDL